MKHGGGAPYDKRWMTGVWGHLTYDPDLDMVFYGSSGAGPASEVQRGTIGGTMAGTDTRWAVKPKTGKSCGSIRRCRATIGTRNAPSK
jgi:alcohol dehydrogenase (cytochrome c)